MIAAVIVLVAVAGVVIWLPARAVVVDDEGTAQPDEEPIAAIAGSAS